MSSSLLVMVPTRGRRAQCERLLKSFEENTDEAEITFITDDDDQETYADMDWRAAVHGMLSPRELLSGKLNRTADACADAFDALMFVADDHVFRTPHWDTIMLAMLKDMGGSGMVYPDDKRRADIPEIIMISSDIVTELGHFANPALKHYYLDNSWAELGKRAGLIRWCPEAVVEHLHYSVCPETERDAVYTETEDTLGTSDREAFYQWRADVLPVQAAILRRKFNADLRWIREKV